jgi:hypothetical protein
MAPATLRSNVEALTQINGNTAGTTLFEVLNGAGAIAFRENLRVERSVKTILSNWGWQHRPT